MLGWGRLGKATLSQVTLSWLVRLVKMSLGSLIRLGHVWLHQMTSR
jgi:hypothetical protein